VFTQGFGLFGNTEETNDSVASGSVTPAPENTPSETSTPEKTPGETPTPEVTPSETPTPENTPSETPTPEVTPTETPELPLNHISAEFFDLVNYGDSFYLDYTLEVKYSEYEYADGRDPDDLWYHVNHFNRTLYQDARQGSLCSSWWDAGSDILHSIFKDNKEYKIHRNPTNGDAEWMMVLDAPPSTTGVMSVNFGAPVRGSSVEYVGSGAGSINGVTMPYDIYNVTFLGETISVNRVYMEGDTVSYFTVYVYGELSSLYSFSEISLTVPPDKLWLLDVPEDLPIVESSETPTIPGR